MMATGKWFKMLGVKRIGFQRILNVLYGMGLMSLIVNGFYIYNAYNTWLLDDSWGARNEYHREFPWQSLNPEYVMITFTILGFFIFNIIIKIFTKFKNNL